MTAQDLKNSILQQAMQGKLVPQDPSDEPASELIKKIKADKVRLIKEGKNRKEKPLLPMSIEEIPYDIPVNWEWERFGNIVNLLSGQDMTPSEYNSNSYGIPYITGASNIDGQDIIINRWTDKAKAVAHKGDLLLTCKGTVGKIAILEEENAHIARQLMAITPLRVDGIFIKFFIENQIPHLKSNAKSLIPGIERNNVLSLCIPIPPLEEQKRIVEKIEELLPLIERYDESEKRLLELNKKFPDELRKAILQQAVQGKLTEQDPHDEPASELLKKIKAEKIRLIKEGKIKKEKPLPPISDDEIPFDIPEGWVWIRLNSIAQKITDGTHHSPPNIQSGDYMYITAKNIKEYGVELHNVTYVTAEIHNEIFSRCNPEFGDLLLIKDGATAGVATVNNIHEPFSMLSSVALIKLCPSVLPEYVVWVLRSNLFYANLRANMKGAAITRVTLKQIEPMLLPLPPLAEQDRIVAKIKELLPLCDSLK